MTIWENTSEGIGPYHLIRYEATQGGVRVVVYKFAHEAPNSWRVSCSQIAVAGVDFDSTAAASIACNRALLVVRRVAVKRLADIDALIERAGQQSTEKGSVR